MFTGHLNAYKRQTKETMDNFNKGYNNIDWNNKINKKTMMYKITGDVDISGKTKGDTIEAEPHAMETYINNGDVEEIKKIKKVAKKK